MRLVAANGVRVLFRILSPMTEPPLFPFLDLAVGALGVALPVFLILLWVLPYLPGWRRPAGRRLTRRRA